MGRRSRPTVAAEEDDDDDDAVDSNDDEDDAPGLEGIPRANRHRTTKSFPPITQSRSTKRTHSTSLSSALRPPLPAIDPQHLAQTAGSSFNAGDTLQRLPLRLAPVAASNSTFVFTVLNDADQRTFAEIPIVDLRARVDFLKAHPKWIEKDNVKRIQSAFMEQAIQFWRMGKDMASASCACCCALLQVSKNQRPDMMSKYLRSLQTSGTQDQQNFSTTLEQIQNIVREQARQQGPLAGSEDDTRAYDPSVAGLLQGLTEMYGGNADRLSADNSRAVDPARSNNPAIQKLRPAYKQRNGDWYKPGKVFAIVWHEAAGESRKKTTDSLMDPRAQEAYELNPALTKARFDSTVFTHIRRMVVVRNRHGFCWCVPIGTYGGRGLTKSGLSANDIKAHTVIHDAEKKPRYFENERKSNKREIAVAMAEGQSLDPASRIHLGKPYNVEWNLKVMDVGQVVPEDLEALIGYVRDEVFGES